MNTATPHWTANSAADFAYSIAADFAAQIELKLESIPLDRKEYAERLGVGKSRVSKLLNDPGNLSVESMVRCARALGMKVAIVAYEDSDPNNEKGPIGSEVFRTAWERAGEPRDMFSFEGLVQAVGLGEDIAKQQDWPFYLRKPVTSVRLFSFGKAKPTSTATPYIVARTIGQNRYAQQ